MQEFRAKLVPIKSLENGARKFLNFLHCSCIPFFSLFFINFLESAKNAEKINKVKLVGKKWGKEGKSLLKGKGKANLHFGIGCISTRNFQIQFARVP
jgi:hypothetical protein